VAATLANRLRELRTQTDLSCRELALIIDSSPAYPSLIEAGKRPRIGAGLAGEIARVFGTTIDYLVSGVGRPPAKETLQKAVARARTAHSRKNKTPQGTPAAPTRKAG
jgi:transcriptional regulator with XRE-family HTH domain